MRGTRRSRVMEISGNGDGVRDRRERRSRALENEDIVRTPQYAQPAEDAAGDVAHRDAIRRVEGEDAGGTYLHAQIACLAPGAVDDQCRIALFVTPLGTG